MGWGWVMGWVMGWGWVMDWGWGWGLGCQGPVVKGMEGKLVVCPQFQGWEMDCRANTTQMLRMLERV
jgi:hypothetical protein